MSLSHQTVPDGNKIPDTRPLQRSLMSTLKRQATFKCLPDYRLVKVYCERKDVGQKSTLGALS